MIPEDFFDEHNNKFVEVSGGGSALNQCVDVANKYIIDVQKKEPLLNSDARDFWDRLSNDYIRIVNTPDRTPEKGDIIIWDTGSYGHIAVATGQGDTNWFQSFDQNWPLGSKCHYVNHNYTGVKGWLRLIKGDEMTDIEKLDVAKALCRERCGRLIDNEVEYIKANFGTGKQPYEDYASNNCLRDNHIPMLWKATTGLSCPKSEIDYWQPRFINNNNELMDLAHIWYKDHVFDKIEGLNKQVELERKKTEEVKENYTELLSHDNTKIDELKSKIRELELQSQCNLINTKTNNIIKELVRRLLDIFKK